MQNVLLNWHVLGKAALVHPLPHLNMAVRPLKAITYPTTWPTTLNLGHNLRTQNSKSSDPELKVTVGGLTPKSLQLLPVPRTV